MNTEIKIVAYTDEKAKDWIHEISKLRIEIFAEYLFLYDGDLEYEERYLQKYMKMKDAIVVAAFDKDEVIGVATGFSFIYESESLKKPLISSGRNPEDFFCCGDLILRKRYRGKGIGQKLYNEMELFARKLSSFKFICLYTSNRPPNDPKRPSDYQSPDSFWKQQDYIKHPELTGDVSYKEIGESEESPKQMVFWIKDL